VTDEDEDESADSLLAAIARIPVRVEPVEWTPPPELDEYRLIQPLGKGGMGSVWLAEDRLLHRLVALKFIARGDEPDAQTRERFAIEARAAARLQHPNVVSVYRYGEIAGRPYLVSEYIRGDSLDKLAKPIGWERALELGIALARGLAAAHRAGIVHRDIKPANAILADDGEAKLVDFGLARLDHASRASRPDELADGSSPEASPLTAPGAIAGTPRYLAPEVRRGDVADRRADIYGIGCVLYELVIGRAPSLDLQHRDTEVPALAAGSAGKHPVRDVREVPSIAERVAASGAAFAAIVDRCLRDDPAHRFATGDELREALEASRTGSLRGAVPEGNPYRGLVAYDAEHRALFFGRDAEIRAVIERLRSDPFVLVTGDSGAGKSSLVRAGVLPVIGDELGDGAWNVIQLVPHHRPLTTLASLLAPLVGMDETVLAALLRDEPGRLTRELSRARGERGNTIVVIDQLEELCTLSEPDELAATSRVLAELARGGPGIRLLATVRSDFLTRVAALPELGTEIARAIYLLRPLTPEGARQAVVGPARAKGATFESEALVDSLVSSVTGQRARIELPLLAFTLAQLWDARDPETQTITTKSLDAIGGVRGALARHADGVLESLLPEQRAAAKKLLLRLVTPERTRARRSAAELVAFGKPALDALVRGRLVVARDDAFELAHERLIDGWPTLAGWVSNTAEAIAAHDRLSAAALAWERLGRTRDGLWAQRQLADLELLDAEDLTATEAAFAVESKRSITRRRWRNRGIAIAVPVIAVGVYAGARLVAARDVARHVGEHVETASSHLRTATSEHGSTDKLRDEAFAQFRAGKLELGEQAWTTARERTQLARDQYGQAARSLEAAFLLDTSRDDVRTQLADLTFERIRLASREHRDTERAELETRLSLYDDGSRAARLAATIEIVDQIAPATAQVSIVPAGVPLVAPTARALLPRLAPGSYVVVARAEGRAPVQWPLVLRPGEAKRVLAYELPAAAAVPAGFSYVFADEFLYGSRDDETMRRFYDAQPMHRRASPRPFLIAKTEITYAQWIAFLEQLSKDERAKRLPRDGDVVAGQDPASAQLALRQVDGTWELQLAPAGLTYKAKLGQPIVYPERTLRASQDWRQFPVSGITAEDVQAYAQWLDREGVVKGARMCTEAEWEQGARGADGRAYPRGDRLQRDDANVDVTYDRKQGGFGPDAVGSHPGSTSVFDLADVSGNVWDLVTSVQRPGFVMRGGAYFINDIAAHLANRQEVPGQFRHPHVGARLCADAP
jgi:formylglycine-generating enzyme required for sulfatase activity